jgi:hypothetical protein
LNLQSFGVLVLLNTGSSSQRKNITSNEAYKAFNEPAKTSGWLVKLWRSGDEKMWEQPEITLAEPVQFFVQIEKAWLQAAKKRTTETP